MSVRTLEQIKKDYDEVQNKIILLSNDMVVLRNEFEILLTDATNTTNINITDVVARIHKKYIMFDKLTKYNEDLDELGIKKIKLIEEYNSQQ